MQFLLRVGLEVSAVFVCSRKFLDMGFIDKDRIAIWGWVSFHFSHTVASFCV